MVIALYAVNLPAMRSFLGTSKNDGCYYAKLTIITSGKERVIAKKIYLNTTNKASVCIPT